MTTMSPEVPSVARGPAVRARVSRVLPPRLFWLPPVLLTALVTGFGATKPQLWRDEFATWSAAHRSLPALDHLTDRIDGVLEPYYLIMHGWLRVAGDSVLALRLPSLAAIALTAGLVAALGSALGSRRAGLIGGLVYALIPSTSRYGEEARPYALAALAAAVATLLLLVALRDGHRRYWCAYAVAVAALGALHLVALLLLLGHAIVLLDEARKHRSARVLLRPAIALTIAVAPLVPLALRGHQQAGEELGRRVLPASLHTLLGLPASVCDSILAGGILVVLAAAGMLLSGRNGVRFGLLTATPLIAFAVIGSLNPLFNPRYALFVVPLACVLAGLALARLRLPIAVALVLAVGVGSLPDQAAVRRSHEFRHNPLVDYQAAAQIVGADEIPGDAIVYRPNGWQFVDIAMEYYLGGREPHDVLADGSRDAAGSYWTPQVSDPARALDGQERVWVVVADSPERPFRQLRLGGRTQAALDLHHEFVKRWRVSGLTVSLYRAR